MIRCLVNGIENGQLPLIDRGMQYGDGLFETIAVFNGKPRHWQLHMQRLHNGCETLGMASPDAENLRDEIARVALDMPRAVVKVIISRGIGERGYVYTTEQMPTRIVASFNFPQYPLSHYQQGVRLRVCDTRLGIQPALAGIKHLNRLENVLARNEWHDDVYAEGLMLDMNGNVIEGTMSNLFWVENGKLFTPRLNQCGVCGIMRQRVIETVADMDIECAEEQAGLERIQHADELFVSNSIIGIWPASLSNNPQRGALTSRLMEKMAATDGTLFI